MNKRLLILALFFSHTASAQFYLRGEVKDEQNNLLPNVRILLHSTSYLYSSGGSGIFGIVLANPTDSVTVSLAGYQSVSMQVDAAKYLTITLRLLHTTASVQKNKLVSFTRDLQIEKRTKWLAAGESYSTLVENEFVAADQYPETGFALRTDKASYSNVRRFLNMDSRVPSDAVRIEELLNYFNFRRDRSRTSSFSIASQLSDCPWNDHNQLLFLEVSAPTIEAEKIPPGNLVFLIDVSGSMDMPNRLPLLKSAFKLLVDNLRVQDTVSIVVYGSVVGVMLPPTCGSDKMKIRKAIEELQPGGSTPGESGIMQAYQLAKSKFHKGGNNRVILATDGDFNIGQSSEEQLEKLITSYKESGIYLTCLGVGMGNYKDSKLEALAKKGNGNFAYLDNEAEAEKVLVKELTQTLYSVADDAYVSVHFNSARVARYKLIGYDNKLKALADTLTEIEGGEVGSGHSTMTIFEIEPVVNTRSMEDTIASMEVNYLQPQDSSVTATRLYMPCNYLPFSTIDSAYRFAATVAMFGQMLKESHIKSNWSVLLTLAHASASIGDPVQQEFLAIIEKAKKIYLKRKKRQ